MGPFAPEYRANRRDNTQNKPKQDNKLIHRLSVRDQEVARGRIPYPEQTD
jgi:hypothetical protein